MFRCELCKKHEAIKRGTRRDKQIYFCSNCQKYFSRSLTKKSPLINREVLRDHLEGISYRKLANRTGVHKKKICELVNLEISNVPDNLELTKICFNQLNYSGNHVIDGKYIPVKEFVDANPVEVVGKIPKSRKR
ncbi:MAG: hypothetical protein WCO03_02720 [bacterium]